MRSMSAFQRVKGTRDFLPEDWYFREHFAKKIISVIESFGYYRVETPVLEHFETLARKSGEAIKDEIYYFRDKAGRELGLRFDMTVPVVRIVSSRPDLPLPIRWYYYSRVWRYDEPQRGRYREFWQIGAELIGIPTLEGDAELLTMIHEIFERLELETLLRINDRRIVDELLAKFGLENRRDQIYRLLDKRRKLAPGEFEASLQQIVPESEILKKFRNFALLETDLDSAIAELQELGISRDLLSELEKLSQLAKDLGIYSWIRFSSDIVRGLDYYTGFCYEIFYAKDDSLALGGGGRYDNLIELYSGRSVPATGFALGFDRILDVLLEAKQLRKEDFLPRIDYWIYYTKPEYYSLALQLSSALRRSGARVLVDISGRRLKASISRASRERAKYFVILGDRELSQGKVYIKNLDTGEERLEDLEKLFKEG
jgi:histidyl-tRNA synthetase